MFCRVEITEAISGPVKTTMWMCVRMKPASEEKSIKVAQVHS